MKRILQQNTQASSDSLSLLLSPNKDNIVLVNFSSGLIYTQS